MLTSLKLRDFRAFPTLECEFAPGLNVIVGPNAQGKTSLLEAACVLLRLQSPRSASLSTLVRIGANGFVLDGFYAGAHLQFYASARRRKLALDSVVQTRTAHYLERGRVVWFSNADMALVRGPAEERRRYLDFLASQLHPLYRRHLRAYERALRSRNQLLRAPVLRWREIDAFDEPLAAAGNAIHAIRAELAAELFPDAAAAHRAISDAAGETLTLEYQPGHQGDLAAALAENRETSVRLRQTTVGPHRDDLLLRLDGLGSDLASEGQQRTIALALRLAQAARITRAEGRPPLFLLDDIFGELDLRRRNALLAAFPAGAQQIVTTTHLHWATPVAIERTFDLSGGTLRRR
ncbi:MAG TPA: DNA replication and repair protein RecF [Chthoniobacteraceae bacterium]|nr:DNA replication and repair protein RecF [Chthoniobacteraceae bacterium]